MASILVTGASGFVASHAIPALVEAGHHVLAMTRDAGAAARIVDRLPAPMRGSVQVREGDVTRSASLPRALDGADAVLHLAAIPRDRDGGASLLRVNRDGTSAMVEAARAAGVRRFLHLGALGVVDRPDLHYGRSKAQAEAIVAGSDLAWTILKPSLLFGPRDGFFNLLADLVRMSPGIVPLTGRGTARFQPLAVADLARAFVLALEQPGTVGGRYELGGPSVWTYREIVLEVLRAMGARRAVVPMPVALIRIVAASAETLRLPFPVATDQLRQLAFDNVGPADGVIRAFGFEPLDMAGRLDYLRRPKRDQ